MPFFSTYAYNGVQKMKIELIISLEERQLDIIADIIEAQVKKEVKKQLKKVKN